MMACSDEDQRYLSTAYVCLFVFVLLLFFFCLPIYWMRFPSHRSDAERRLRGDRGQPACHCHLEFFPLCVVLPPFPIPVFTTRGAQDRIRRPPHLLPLCDFRSALHLTSVDYWAEREFHSFCCCCCCCLVGRGWDWWLYGVFSRRSPTPSRRAWNMKSYIMTTSRPSLTSLWVSEHSVST